MTNRDGVSARVRIRQSLACALVSLALAGCGTLAPARLPDGAPGEARPPVVTVGAQARARLLSGRIITGEVTAVTDSSVTLGRVGNYGYEERVVLACDIAELKAEDRSSPAYQAVAASSVLMTLVAIAAVALFAAIGHIPSN